jgi:hypothetical protein
VTTTLADVAAEAQLTIEAVAVVGHIVWEVSVCNLNRSTVVDHHLVSVNNQSQMSG